MRHSHIIRYRRVLSTPRVFDRRRLTRRKIIRLDCVKHREVRVRPCIENAPRARVTVCIRGVPRFSRCSVAVHALVGRMNRESDVVRRPEGRHGECRIGIGESIQSSARIVDHERGNGASVPVSAILWGRQRIRIMIHEETTKHEE